MKIRYYFWQDDYREVVESTTFKTLIEAVDHMKKLGGFYFVDDNGAVAFVPESRLTRMAEYR